MTVGLPQALHLTVAMVALELNLHPWSKLRLASGSSDIV